MAGKRYSVNGKVDSHKFGDYSRTSEAIRKIIPGKDFQIKEIIIYGVCNKKNKIDIEVEIDIPNDEKNHQKEFKKIKYKLEGLFDTDLDEFEY